MLYFTPFPETLRKNSVRIIDCEFIAGRHEITYSSCMTDIEIGRIIREQRIKKGFSQTGLAKKVGVTWEMISRYERGKSSALQKILVIAEALDLEVSRFFGAPSPFPSFNYASSEYVTSRFVPILDVMPATPAELVTVLACTETGSRIYDDGVRLEKFGVRLGADSKLRIETGNLLPRGVLICTLALGDLTEHSVVLVARNGLVSIEQFVPNDTKATILARVTEWVVKM